LLDLDPDNGAKSQASMFGKLIVSFRSVMGRKLEV